MAERSEDVVVTLSFRPFPALPVVQDQRGPVAADLPAWRPRLMWARDATGTYDRLTLYHPRWTAADAARNRLLLRRLAMED